MGEILGVILKIVGGTTVLVGAVTFLSKMLINHLFQKDLEKFKSDLEQANQIKLIELRSKTENLFHEYKENIKNLSGERIKAVKDLHNKTIEVYAAYSNAISIMRTVDEIPVRDQRANDFATCGKKLNELLECTKQNEIFIPTILSEKIFQWRKKLSITIDIYGPVIYQDQSGQQKELIRLWDELNFEEAVFNELRKELKMIIGVES